MKKLMTQVKIINFAQLRNDEFGNNAYKLYLSVNSGFKFHLDSSFKEVIYFDSLFETKLSSFSLFSLKKCKISLLPKGILPVRLAFIFPKESPLKAKFDHV